MNAISNLGLLAVLLAQAPAAAQNRSASLAQAQETFAAVDTNKDGKLSPEELAALKLQLTRNDTRGIDFDRDGFWSRDEFLLFYRQRLLAADVKPGADLEAEGTRILAARKAKTSERGPRRPAPESPALATAVDELQAKAASGQAVGSDFDRMRDLLVADARSADQLARGQDAALGEHSELQRQLLATIERLRTAAVAGQFSREEYMELRAAMVKRARGAAAAVPETSPDLRAIEQGLTEALDRLEQRAVAGNASREDFERVRDQLIARARAAAAPGAAEQELQSPLHAQMVQTLERLQAAAAGGTFSREEFLAFREAIVKRFRNAQKAPPEEAGLNQAADELEKRVNGGAVTPADFAKLRGLISDRLTAASAKTDAGSVNEANLYRKLMQSLERLENAAQTGSVDRQEYQAFRDSFVHRARQIASSSQQSNGTTGNASGEQASGAKRGGANARGEKGEKSEKSEKTEKTEPTPAPPARPKPASGEPEKPPAQPPSRPPHEQA